MTDIVDGIEAGHILQLQVIDRMALALGEHSNQDISARNLFPTGGLDMNCGPLQHTLESSCGLRVLRQARHHHFKLTAKIFTQLFLQLLDIDATGPYHRDCVAVLRQRE